MQSELSQLVAEGKITKNQAAILEQLAPGSYAMHKSWGCARIVAFDPILAQLDLEFHDGRRQSMQAAFASTVLTPIPASHVEARRMADPAAARKEALDNPVNYIHTVVSDYNSRLTIESLSDVLSSILRDPAAADKGQADFKRWWTSTRAKLKADGRFIIPSKKNEFITLRERPDAPHLDVLTDLEAARTPKAQATAAEALLRSISKFDDATEELSRALSILDKAAKEQQRRNPSHSIHLLCIREEIIERGKEISHSPTITLAELVAQAPSNLADALAPLPSPRIRLALETAAPADDLEAAKLLIDVLPNAESKVVIEATRILLDREQLPPLRRAIQNMIAQRHANPEVLAWLLSKRPDALSDLINVETIEVAITVLERETLIESKRIARLLKTVSDDKELFKIALTDANIDAARDLVRKIMRTPIFEGTDERTLLARAIKARPELQKLLEDDDDKPAEPSSANKFLTVSWASLERRKKDYDELVQVRIPANTHDIKVAREQGDLRENSGYKYAKEQEAILNRKKAELEHLLASCRGTNFENPDTSIVSIGTTVVLRDATTDKEEKLHILGAWDGDASKNIVSYLAAVATALLEKPVGAIVSLPSESGERQVEIVSISAFKNLDIL